MAGLEETVHGKKKGGSDGTIVLTHEGLFTHNGETFSEDQLIGAASLVSRHVDDTQICASLGLNTKQLEILRTSPEYQKELAQQTQAVVLRGIGADNKWDQLEEAALTGVIDDLNRGGSAALETRELLMLASVANKAKRRNGARADASHNTTVNVDARTQTVNLKLPSVLVDRLSGLSKSDEEEVKQKVLSEEVLTEKYSDFQDMSLDKSDVARVLNVDVDAPQRKGQSIREEFLEMATGFGAISDAAG